MDSVGAVLPALARMDKEDATVSKIKENVGLLDAYLRLTLGFTVLGLGMRHKIPLAVLLGSMKIAEGVTRFCPILSWLDKDTLHWKCGSIQE